MPKKALERLDRLQEIYDKLESDLRRGFDKVYEARKEKVEAWRDKAVAAETTPDKIHLTES